MTIQLQRFRVEQVEDGSWSVIDVATDLAVRLSDEPMILLQERFARALADFLNLEDQMGGSVTFQ